MTHVSHRLKGSFEGALAGGGDPATSPKVNASITVIEYTLTFLVSIAACWLLVVPPGPAEAEVRAEAALESR